MTLNEALEIVRKAFPNATIGDDFDGQLIIYTDSMYDSENDECVPFEVLEDSDSPTDE